MMEYTAANVQQWTRLGMRKSLGGMLLEIAQEQENFLVLAADVATSANLQDFAARYPSRFYNLGISEQNMVAMAAGLAKEGSNVFVVSFAPFVALRAFEALRTVVGYMHLNVKVVALSSGLSLGTQGMTHYCIEDIALMRTIPGMLVLSPADCTEMAKCLEYLVGFDGPAYLRLTGIDGTPAVYRGDYSFDASKNIVLREGGDVALLATGTIVNECVRAARALKRDGLECSVVDVHTLKPLDKDFIDQICKNDAKLIVTVEEHTILGGLGSAVAECLAEKENHPPLLRIGIGDVFPQAGDYAYVQQLCGLTAPQIRDQIMNHLR